MRLELGSADKVRCIERRAWIERPAWTQPTGGFMAPANPEEPVGKPGPAAE